jgi:biopolymer transport protein ExbD
LVLLIIFMVTTSVIVQPAIKVDLPKAANADDNPESTVALILTKQGELFVNGQPTTWPQLPLYIRKKQRQHDDLQAVISADKDVSHGRVVHLIDVIKGLGIIKFALNIERVSYRSEDHS